jgi:hypothetical protein
MSLVVQTGEPHVLTTREVVPDLQGALQTIYPMATERAILFWNGIPVRLDYKYDLSLMLDELLRMVLVLSDPHEHELGISWGSDTFTAVWQMEWGGDRLLVRSGWESIGGGYERLLNSRHELEMSRRQFMAEWKMLFLKIADAIDRSGITISAEVLNKLVDTAAQIPGRGWLYPREGQA